MRQSANLVGVNAKEMLKVLEEHNSYINYGEKELEEDIAYASGEFFHEFTRINTNINY